MAATMLRLLTLAALMLMPFTMAASRAEAHAMPEQMSAEHCGDQHQPAPDAPSTMDMAQCMLMCAALPAAETLTIAPPSVPKAPRRLALAEPTKGIILEIATPPPRFA